METVFGIFMAIIAAAWDVLLESSVFILFGFFVAGLLKAYIPDDFIQRHLGGKSKMSIFKSSLFGIPIPLCSCGVIPAAAGLRSQGASKGSVTSFMVSTPETGVDSIAVTYALLDPVMTVVRPVAAFFTAIASGLAVNLFDKGKEEPGEPAVGHVPVKPQATILPMAESRTMSPVQPSGGQTEKGARPSGLQGMVAKFRKGMAFAFGGLLESIGPWLIFGIFLAGVITVVISPAFISSYLGSGLFAMLVMIVLATPLYVCATASTPIAAALALKGLSPGAALVFLLAGPATNMATITVVARLLGKKTAVIYVGSIMICSVTLGLIVNWLYLRMGLDITGWVSSAGHEQHGLLYILAAVLFLLLIVRPYALRIYHRLFHAEETASHHHCGCGQ